MEAITDRQLVRVQSASGATFALFALVHLVNQALAVLGAARYDRVQGVLRRGYQWAPAEVALVLTPLAVHMAACLVRIVRRRRSGLRPSSHAGARLHRASGLFLLVVIAGHVVATRGASLLYGVYPGFHGVAFTFRWVPVYFWPYYLLLAVGGFYHAVYGLGVALPVLGLRPGAALRRPAALTPVAVVGGLALVAGVLALGGVLADVGDPARSPYALLLGRLGFVH